MGCTVVVINNTETPVQFGFWNAPSGDTGTRSKTVVKGSPEKLSISDCNARIIAAWISKDELYPNNNKPLTTGCLLVEGRTYQVMLTTNSISVSPAESTKATA